MDMKKKIAELVMAVVISMVLASAIEGKYPTLVEPLVFIALLAGLLGAYWSKFDLESMGLKLSGGAFIVLMFASWWFGKH